MEFQFLARAFVGSMLCSAANAQMYNSHVALPSTLAGQNTGGAESTAMDRSNGFPTAGGGGTSRTSNATSGTEPTGDGTSRNVGTVPAAAGTAVAQHP
jgi:hypothetical protein